MNEKPVNDADDDLLDHYDIDFSKAKPNPYAAMFGPLRSGGRVVYLDPEVAERFATSEDVNRVLMALVKTMPPANIAKKTLPTQTRATKPTRANARKPGPPKKSTKRARKRAVTV